MRQIGQKKEKREVEANMSEDLTQEYLDSILLYSPNAGEFRWKNKKGKKITPGQIAGYINHYRGGMSYRIIQIDGVNYRAHRLAWLYTYGSFPKNHIDHIDGDGTNNKIKNLRSVTRTENQKNTRLRADNTSGVVGISWDTAREKWHSYISDKGRRITLGYFKNKEKAVEERKKAEIKYGYHPNHGKLRA